MKTTMKQLAAGTILALLLMVINVRTEGKEAAKALSLETTETTLELENWMMDNNVWNETSTFNFEAANDEALNLEDWMTSEITWEKVQSMETKTEKDNDLKLENWMTEAIVWDR